MPGTSWCLPRMVGTGKAMMMLMTSEVLKGSDAHRLGICEKVFEPDELLPATVEFAQQLAASVPAASLAVIKQQVWHHTWMDRESALRQSNRLMGVSLHKDGDFMEGATVGRILLHIKQVLYNMGSIPSTVFNFSAFCAGVYHQEKTKVSSS